MSDLGRNEIADHKHEKPPAGSHFRPQALRALRALRALGRKWKPLGGFSCLRSAIPFLPSSLMQKLPISIYLKVCYKLLGIFYGVDTRVRHPTRHINGVGECGGISNSMHVSPKKATAHME